VLEPAAKIDHFNVTRFGAALAAFFFYQRCYAVARARLFRWSLARRAAYIVLAPLVPFYFAARFCAFLVRARPDDLPLFLRNVPMVLILQASGALGQALGLLFGPGAAEGSYTRHELCEHRPAPPAGRKP
jgi:hypothetical protein